MVCTAVTRLTGNYIPFIPAVEYSYASAEETEFIHELFTYYANFMLLEEKKSSSVPSISAKTLCQREN